MATYDEKLLAAAPEVTKADLQDGYNPDLLREPTVKRTPSARAAPIPPRSNSDSHQHDLESSAPLQPKEAPYDTDLGRKKKPFWRTTKGMAIIGTALLVVIILAAVLGGVLGSRHKGTNTNSGNGKGGNGTSNEGASGGDSGNGAGSTNNPTSSGIDPNQPVAHSTRPISSVTQPAGTVPTGSSSSGSPGTVVPSGVPSGGDSGSQSNANGGSGTTGGTSSGVVEPPTNANPGTTDF